MMFAVGSLSLASRALHGTTTVVKLDTRIRSLFATISVVPLILTVTVCVSDALPSVAWTVYVSVRVWPAFRKSNACAPELNVQLRLRVSPGLAAIEPDVNDRVPHTSGPDN